MSGWNYRVFKKQIDGKTSYGLHECYYDDNDKPDGWTENAVKLDYFDTPEELQEALQMMFNDVNKSAADILDYDKPAGSIV